MESAIVPKTTSPTTVSMNIVSNAEDGCGMAEVIRSDGKQVYHTVNVNVNGVVKRLMVPLGKSADMTSVDCTSELNKTAPTSSSFPGTSKSVASSSESIENRANTINSSGNIPGCCKAAAPSSGIQLVIPSPTTTKQTILGANVPRAILKPATKTVSILPATNKMAFPVIKPALPNQSGRPAIFLVPKNNSTLAPRVTVPHIVMPNNQGKVMPTVIPLPGSRFAVPKGQTGLGGKSVFTLVPQGQTLRAPGASVIVTPRPNIPLAPGYALVPVSSSNAFKHSDVLNIPGANKPTLDNQALNDLLKTIAQQTVNSNKAETINPIIDAIPVKAMSVPKTTSSLTIVTTSSSIPSAIKLIPASVSNAGLTLSSHPVLSTKASTGSDAENTATNFKIDSVYSLNNDSKLPESVTQEKNTVVKVTQENGSKNCDINPLGTKRIEDINGDTDKSDPKEDFVVLAEWAKESDNEGEDCDDADCQNSSRQTPEDLNDQSDKDSDNNENDSVDIETVSKDEEGLTRNKHVSEMVLTDLKAENGEKVEANEDNDKDSQTTEIADLNTLEADLAETQEVHGDEECDEDAVKENKVSVVEDSQQKTVEELSGKSMALYDNNDKDNMPKKVNEIDNVQPVNDSRERHHSPRLKTVQHSDVVRQDDISVTNILGEGCKQRRSSYSVARVHSESPRAKRTKHRKRKLKMVMKIKYWKREHKYMFDCMILMPRLPNLDPIVDLTTFKPPVIPKHILSNVRFVGDANWSDVTIDRVPNRQNKRRRSQNKEKIMDKTTGDRENRKREKLSDSSDQKSKCEEIFIVKTVNGESKLVKMPSPDKKAYLRSIAPKLSTAIKTVTKTTAAMPVSSSNALPKTVSSTAVSVQPPVASLKSVIRVSCTTSVSSTTAGPSPPKVIVTSATGKKPFSIPVIAKPNAAVSQIAKPTALATRTVIALPSYAKGGTGGRPLQPSLKKAAVSLMPIAKKTPGSIPVSVAGGSVSVPISMLMQAQAMGCKLAFQVPTSSSGAPRPLFIPSTNAKASSITTSAATKPLFVTSAASGNIVRPVQLPGSGIVKPLVIAPVSTGTEKQVEVPTPVSSATSTTPIIIKPRMALATTCSVSSPTTSAISTTSQHVSSTSTTAVISSRSGNQRYLVLNTSSGKMIVPMPAGGGNVTIPGKSILNIPSVVPQSLPASLSAATTSSPPVFIMSPSSNASVAQSPMKSAAVNTSAERFPFIVKRVSATPAGTAPRAVVSIRPSQPTPVQTPVQTPVVTRSISTQQTAPTQRSPAARQNRMIQRLSEFMSPAAAAALAASVPAEPIEITPRPIKIEPDDSADVDCPIRIKEEPRTEGYGDEVGAHVPVFSNVPIKDEPVSSDSGSDSDEANGEPPLKQAKLDGSAAQANSASVPSPVPKAANPPSTHDARSRIEELREKLKKAMADVDEIRQKRQAVAEPEDIS